MLSPDAPAPLTLGILSVLPTQTVSWHRHHLCPATTLDEPARSITRAAQTLRDAGADLLIVLAHMGVGHTDGPDGDVQAAHALVECGNIDALILGHTHRRLPSGDYADRSGVDIHHSTVGGVPAIMAGHAGSDLGVIDLSLGHDLLRGWHVTNHTCSLRPNDASVPPDPAIVAHAIPDHTAVTRQLSAQVASTSRRLHSYFSLASPAPTQDLTARAQHNLIRDALIGTPYADIPLLSSAAAHGAGGARRARKLY